MEVFNLRVYSVFYISQTVLKHYVKLEIKTYDELANMLTL